MTNELVPHEDLLPGNLRPELIEDLKATVKAARQKGTLAAYASDTRKFLTWCQEEGVQPLPFSSKLVASYLVWLSREGHRGRTKGGGQRRGFGGPLSISSIQRARASLAVYYKFAGFPNTVYPDPLIQETIAGLRHTLPRKKAKKLALRPHHLREMLAWVDRTASPYYRARNRALILLGFRCGLRRGELVGLDRADIEIRPDRLLVNLRRTTIMGTKVTREGLKTDESAKLPVAYEGGECCAFTAVLDLLDWLDSEANGIVRENQLPYASWQERLQRARVTGKIVSRHGRELGDYKPYVGSLFIGADTKNGDRLSPGTVAVVLKHAALAVGLDPRDIGGHSLRSGFVTSSILAGKSVLEIKKQTRHRDLGMLSEYFHELEPEMREDVGKGLLGDKESPPK